MALLKEHLTEQPKDQLMEIRLDTQKELPKAQMMASMKDPLKADPTAFPRVFASAQLMGEQKDFRKAALMVHAKVVKTASMKVSQTGPQMVLYWVLQLHMGHSKGV
jgi:hypothetical protein